MANLLIKGMEMPKAGQILQVAENVDGNMFIRETTCGEWHPLVEVPPHGRLVDADKLLIDIMDRNIDQAQFDDYSEFCHAIHEAPTVIEASEEA